MTVSMLPVRDACEIELLRFFVLLVGDVNECDTDDDTDGGDRDPFVGEVTVVSHPSGDKSGLRVRRVKRENMPLPFSHWKYRIPATEPSFLPVKHILNAEISINIRRENS